MNHSPGIAEEIRELLESKQELVSGGPHRNAIRLLLDVKEHLEQENERITKEREKWEAEARLQYRLFNEEIDASRKLREEKEQVKKERDFYKNVRDPHETLLSLRSELAAKDKVLEWYGDEESYFIPSTTTHQLTLVERDNGVRARKILLQYKEADTSEK